jgi:autotransporter strand-loop-strand O-heptosyltransferase
MFKEIKVKASFNERTGYGIHASRFFPELQKLVPSDGTGTVHIALLDTVSASQATEFAPSPSILYNVWESDEQPQDFIDKLKHYDQLWVPSEWQRAASIAQGVPEEFVKVVPEGVDPEIYKPVKEGEHKSFTHYPFTFLVCGQWQHRKSTLEIIQAFLKAFPAETFSRFDQAEKIVLYQDVRLELSVDTLFPSDPYKSTEERLKAYGIDDPRISVIHFEERADYIRRLQSAHCFVSCSRSEGWGLPIGEAIAVGLPTIVADWGGSTEYAGNAINVRIKELRKPEGIYGGWNVPGHWAEPDYDHLVEQMKLVYNTYPIHKTLALENAEVMRTEFSWKAAAEKAYKILEELADKVPLPIEEKMVIRGDSFEKDMRTLAAKNGMEITGIKKRKAIFSIDCHPCSQERIDVLIETINQVRPFGYPILVVAHLPLPEDVIKLCDYYIYDKNDIMSGDDLPTYSRTKPDGTVEYTKASKPCHALAGLLNWRNAINFCRGRWDWIYQMNSDVEIDINEWMEKVYASDKDIIAVRWEGAKDTFGGQICASRVEAIDKIFFPVETWEQFAATMKEHRFCSERGYYRIAEQMGLENIEFIDIEMGNLFDQVDREAWGEDTFQYHFVEGPFVQINGMSKNEYDVEFSSEKHTYKTKLKANMWCRPEVKYYQDWTLTVHLNGELKLEHKFNPTGQKILISMGSKALGDTIAWMPYIEEFRKKHDCHVVCSGWWQEMFDYPEIEFVKPGALIDGVYASYGVGCYDDQLNLNVTNWRSTNLQQVAADILGVEYKPIRAKLKVVPHKKKKKPYICFSEHSTMRNKLWNREGAWQKVIDHVKSLGMDAISISNEKSAVKGVLDHANQSIQRSITDIDGCEFYVGLNAGPSWIAYALGKPVIMLTGVSEEWNDFPNPYRIAINNEVCGIGCFNDPTLPISRDWLWCPRDKDYICTGNITEQMVMDMIDQVMADVGVPHHDRKHIAIGQPKVESNHHDAPEVVC